MNSNNILQGNKFLKNKKKFKNKKFIEGFSTGNTKENARRVREIAAEYNGKVSEYGLEYEKLINKKLNSEDDVFNLFGKTVKFGNKLYFVTNLGVLREIQNPYAGRKTLDEFYETSRFKSYECPKASVTLTRTQFNSLTKGKPLKYEYNSVFGARVQRCNDRHILNGSIQIKHNGTGVTAWIDDLGSKYLFKDENNKNKSCGTSVHYGLDGPDWDLIDNSNELGPADICPSQAQNSQLKLNKLNFEMKEQAKQMKGIINDMKSSVDSSDGRIRKEAKKFDYEVDVLRRKRKKIDTLEKEIFALNGNIRDNTYGVKSVNLNYLAWGASLTTLIALYLVMIKK